MYRSTLLAGVVALAGSAAATCIGDGGFVVSTGCVCPSSEFYDSGACTDTGSLCASVPTSSDRTFTTAGMNLTTAEMDGTTTTVTLNLAMPMLQGRNYTGFYILAPTSNTPGTYDGTACNQAQFTGITTAAGEADCKDRWTLTTLFNRLRGCGFTVQSNSGGFEVYDGVIRVAFDEPVTIGTTGFTQDLTRSASIDFPFRVRFDSQFTYELNSTNLKVVSDYQVDFAIVNQAITPTTNPTVDVQYTIQYPYAITAWRTISSTNSALAPSINALVQCTTGEYSYSADPLTSTCKHQNRITFTTSRDSDAGCQFNGDVITLPFTVGCASGLATAECPFTSGTENTDIRNGNDNNDVTFTLTSENFCTGDRGETSTINNAITLKEFKSVSSFGSYPSGGTQQNAWRYGDYGFYQILLDGLPVQTFTISTLKAKFGDQTDYAADNRASRVDLGSGCTTDCAWKTQQTVGSIVASDLGLHTGDVANYGFQDYRFALLMDTNLFGTALTAANRGQQYPLRLQAVCDVSYNTNENPLTNARRRRRQASTTASGTGTVESAEATITAPEEAAAQPSSAVRTGPVLALAVALLSAVLMA